MQTTHYTFTAQEIVMSGDGVEEAAGGARHLVCLCPYGGVQPREKGDNVIDLAAWRADRAGEDTAAQEGWGPEELEKVQRPARRPRRECRPSMGAEWLATLSVIAVMAALLVKIISF